MDRIRYPQASISSGAGSGDLVRAEIPRELGEQLGYSSGSDVADPLESGHELLGTDSRAVPVDPATRFLMEQDRLEDPVQERSRLVAFEALVREIDGRSDEIGPRARGESAVRLEAGGPVRGRRPCGARRPSPRSRGSPSHRTAGGRERSVRALQCRSCEQEAAAGAGGGPSVTNAERCLTRVNAFPPSRGLAPARWSADTAAMALALREVLARLPPMRRWALFGAQGDGHGLGVV
jgi:hypothetical protein